MKTIKNNNFYLSWDNIFKYIEMVKDYDGTELFEILKKHLPRGASILELGSGPGKDLSSFSQYYRICGSDFSPIFLEYLEDKFPQIEILELDAITIQTPHTYDCVFSNKVLHHLSDDEFAQSIERQHEIINEGGLVMHTFWRGEGTEQMKDMFVQYHKRENIKKSFSQYFDVAELTVYTELEEDDSILFVGKKRSNQK